MIPAALCAALGVIWGIIPGLVSVGVFVSSAVWMGQVGKDTMRDAAAKLDAVRDRLREISGE